MCTSAAGYQTLRIKIWLRAEKKMKKFLPIILFPKRFNDYYQWIVMKKKQLYKKIAGS